MGSSYVLTPDKKLLLDTPLFVFGENHLSVRGCAWTTEDCVLDTHIQAAVSFQLSVLEIQLKWHHSCTKSHTHTHIKLGVPLTCSTMLSLDCSETTVLLLTQSDHYKWFAKARSPSWPFTCRRWLLCVACPWLRWPSAWNMGSTYCRSAKRWQCFII